MNKKKQIISKIIATFFLVVISLVTNAQDNSGNTEINGTFTIYISSIKNSDIELTEEQKLEIESLRKDNEDFEVYFDDMKVLIMSRDKMEADYRWPQYSLINK
jgi:hypothetical protein